jgi:CRISPR type II-A-associated protein Csn2
MRCFVRDLSGHDNDSDLSFIDDGQKLTIGEEVEAIFNPLKLNFNNRKAIAALLKILAKTSVDETFYLQTAELKTKIFKYFIDIIYEEQFDFKVITEDFLVDALAKAVNIHIVEDEANFIQLITEYLIMMRELVHTRLFVFVNLRGLITDDELEQLIFNMKNHQLDILLVECVARKPIQGIERLVIDDDLCEI